MAGTPILTYTNGDKCPVSDRPRLQTSPIEILSHVFICMLTDRGNLDNCSPSHRSWNRHTQRGSIIEMGVRLHTCRSCFTGALLWLDKGNR